MKIDKKVVCCLCVRNCAQYLNTIFENLDLLSSLFTKFYVIFVYDNCDDGSEHFLFQYKKRSKFKVYVVHNYNNNSEYRTFRIANSRNLCLNIIYNEIKSVDFHFMVDADNENVEKWDLEVIEKYLQHDNWDALSFNRRKFYYDVWALSFDEYKHHCWGFGDTFQGIEVCKKMGGEITNKLNSLEEYELQECWSAFNGFAIYRTDKFCNVKYDGSYQSVKSVITDEERELALNKLRIELGMPFLFINDNLVECCEHIYFHFSAIQKNNVRIRISKQFM
jgi:hypothetical protein